jgi:hypothetical protein
MQTLAKLAGEDTFDISKEVDYLATGIKAYPDFGIDKKHVDAVSNIAKITTKWIASAYQERSVRDMVKDGNNDLQTALDGMLVLVSYYEDSNNNEKRSVLGFFEVEIPFAISPKDKLLATLARAHVQSKESEYDKLEHKYDDAKNGIRLIANGHKKLFENIDKLSDDNVKSTIKNFAKDIMIIRDNLQSVHT